MTGEEPVGAEVRPPGLRLQQDVDVADAGSLPRLQVSLSHHPDLPPVEDDGGVRSAGVVKLAGQQVQPDTERLAGNFPEDKHRDPLIPHSREIDDRAVQGNIQPCLYCDLTMNYRPIGIM